MTQQQPAAAFPPRATWRGALLALLLGALLGLVWMWPLPLHWSSHLPVLPSDSPFAAEQDSQLFAWNLWWFRQALLSGKSPFWCDQAGIPHGFGLGLNSYSSANGLLALPLQSFLSLEATYNLLLLVGYAGSALAGYLLLCQFGLGGGVALFGGLLLASAPSHVLHVPCHLNIASSYWLLLLLGCWHRRQHSPAKLSAALGAGLLLALAIGASWYFLVYALLASAVVLLAGYWEGRSQLGKRGLELAGAWATGLALSSPVWLAAWSEYTPGATAMRWAGRAEALAVSFHPLQLLLPTEAYLRLVGGEFLYEHESALFQGYLALGLALYGLGELGWRRGRLLLGWAALGTLIAFGPWELGYHAWLYDLLMSVPVLDGARVPARAFLLAEPLLAVAAALGLHRLWRTRLSGSAVGAVLGGALALLTLAERRPQPLTIAAPPREFLAQVGAHHSGPLLTLPNAQNTRQHLYAQVYHQRPVSALFQARPDRRRQRTSWPPPQPGEERAWLRRQADLAVGLGASGLLLSRQAIDELPGGWTGLWNELRLDGATPQVSSFGYLPLLGYRPVQRGVYPYSGWYGQEELGEHRVGYWSAGREADVVLVGVAPGEQVSLELTVYGCAGCPEISVTASWPHAPLERLAAERDRPHPARLVLTVPPTLSGAGGLVVLTASHAFRPAQAEPGSQDQRELAFMLREEGGGRR